MFILNINLPSVYSISESTFSTDATIISLETVSNDVIKPTSAVDIPLLVRMLLSDGMTTVRSAEKQLYLD